MILDILGQINDFFIGLGYWGIFLACLGLFPAEPLIAMYAAAKPDQIILISVVASLGEVLGAYFTYLVGMLFKEESLIKNIRKNGLFLNITEQGYLKCKKDVKKNGFLFITFSRLVPWLRVVTAVAAGFLRYNIPKFSIAVFSGTFVYAYIFAIAGVKLGDSWTRVGEVINRFNNVFLVLIVAFVIYKGWNIYKKTKKRIKKN